MGFKRFLKKTLIPGYDAVNTIKNISQYGVVDGIKQKIKEDYLEDMPGTSHIYNVGKHDGKKEGYIQASYEYEKKLLKQAEEFLSQRNKFETDKRGYEELINDYEKYIDEITQKQNLAEQQRDYLNQIVIMERKLKNLK